MPDNGVAATSTSLANTQQWPPRRRRSSWRRRIRSGMGGRSICLDRLDGDQHLGIHPESHGLAVVHVEVVALERAGGIGAADFATLHGMRLAQEAVDGELDRPGYALHRQLAVDLGRRAAVPLADLALVGRGGLR